MNIQQRYKKINNRKDHPNQLYRLNQKQKGLLFMKTIAVFSTLSYLFYESMLPMLLFSPLMIVYYRKGVRSIQTSMKWQLNLQFQDALAAMTSALSAGYSIENSISEARKDLLCIYKETDLIVKQYEEMEKKIKLNITVEDVFFDFAQLSEIEDIRNFAWILYTAKRTGGDLLKITRSTNEKIAERIEVNREIRTVISGKQLESNIMSVVPLGMILYLKLGCSGLLKPLYGNLAGIIVMTVMLVVYMIAYLWCSHIVNIEV